MGEFNPTIECDFDPTKICPMKELIYRRGKSTGLSRLVEKLVISGWGDDGLPAIMGVVPDTCEDGPGNGIFKKNVTCSAEFVHGSREELVQQLKGLE